MPRKSTVSRRPKAGAGAGAGAGVVALAISGVLLCAAPSPAGAYDAMVQATMVSQNYQLRDAAGNGLSRLRLDTYLRLFVLDILPQDKQKRNKSKRTAQMQFVAGMRLRADAGDYMRQWHNRYDLHGREGGTNPMFELMYAHLSITDVAGVIDLQIGRQFQLDPLDFYGFDGLRARLRLPFHLAVEFTSGLRNSGAFAFDAPIFLIDGTDLTDSKPGWLPMVGAALETTGLSFLKVRLAYRATWHVLDETDPGRIYPTEDGERIPRVQLNEEKVSAFVKADLMRSRIQAYAGFRYNLLTSHLDDIQIGLATAFSKKWRLRAEYVRDTPNFDGDSIFNIFNVEPYQEVRLWYEHRFTPRWRFYARASVRLFGGGDPDAPEVDEKALIEVDAGGGTGFVYYGNKMNARVDAYWQEGYGGRTLGLFGFYRHRIIPGLFSLEGRAVIAYWDDDLGVTPEGVSAGIGVGGRLSLGKHVALHVLVEDNFGTYTKSDLRIFAMLNFTWCKSGKCSAGEVMP